MSFPKYRWTSRSEELRKEIASLQSKLEKENLSSTAINEISAAIHSKKSELKMLREGLVSDVTYMVYDDE